MFPLDIIKDSELGKFTYEPPELNFDPNRVFGTICRLIKVCDRVYSTAIQVAAGDSLFHVVVDTEATAVLLLKYGRLQSQCTLTPLKGISSSAMDPEILRMAQEIGGGKENVQLALDLITYPDAVKPIMKCVFGNTLVCRDQETVERVAAHPLVNCCCVTLGGDFFEPPGKMTSYDPNQVADLITAFEQDEVPETETAAENSERRQVRGH